MEARSSELRTLNNVIKAAEGGLDIELLRTTIKVCVDQAPSRAVIAMAKYIYDRGVEIEQLSRN